MTIPPRPPLPPRRPGPAAVVTAAPTVIIRRVRGRWMLVPAEGAVVELTGSVVILGRNPAPDAAFPEAQLVRVRDRSRTLSKTHARIERRDDGWIVVDLGSTNGVLVMDRDGTAYDATPGAPARVADRLVLGDVEVRLAAVA